MIANRKEAQNSSQQQKSKCLVLSMGGCPVRVNSMGGSPGARQ